MQIAKVAHMLVGKNGPNRSEDWDEALVNVSDKENDVQIDALMGAAKEGGHLQKLLSVHACPR
jgi:hypothetical protein